MTVLEKKMISGKEPRQKVVSDRYDFSFIGNKRPRRRLAKASLVVRIGHRFIEVGICDDRMADSVIVDNPLYGENGLEDFVARYDASPGKCEKALSETVEAVCSGLLNVYGKEKAARCVVATCGLYAKLLLRLPIDARVAYEERGKELAPLLHADETTFAPIYDEYVGDLLAETVSFPDNSLVVDAEDVLTVLYIGKDNDTVASMWAMTYDEIGLRALRAAVRTLTPDGYQPFVRLTGRYAEECERSLLEAEYPISFVKKRLENVAKVFTESGFLSKWAKEKSRISTLDIVKSDRFQDYFCEE